MDPDRIAEALNATLNPDTNKEGEKVLNECQKIIGFTPMLLRIVVEGNIQFPTKQAASLFFKNTVGSNWKIREPEEDGDPIPFSIHEDDKQIIRANVMQAIISSPAPIQIQLKSALATIIKYDYPTKYESLNDTIKAHLNVADYHSLNGALLALYALCQNYEYSKLKEWVVLDNFMRELLPVLQNMMTLFAQEKSDEALALQKLILKCLNAYLAFHFPLNTLNENVLPGWISLCCNIAQDFSREEDEDCEGLYWKNKKWAINILSRISDKYGNPGSVTSRYKAFAQYYLKAFSKEIVCTSIKICDRYSKNKYVAPRVLCGALKYIKVALSNAFSWNFVRGDFGHVIEKIIHPLLSHNDEDEDLWQDDPNEFIRFKAVVWNELGSDSTPNEVAYSLLEDVCKKRKGMLDHTMNYCVSVLTDSSKTDRELDGALHMIGAVSDLLLSRKAYKNQLETFLISHVIPTLQCPERFRRLRACWLLSRLASAQFTNEDILVQVADTLRILACNDPELPVRTIAASSLFDFAEEQVQIQELLKPHLSQLLIKLLELLRETEFDELSNVIERIIYIYRDDIGAVAKEIMSNLSETLMRVMKFNEHEGPNQQGDTDVDEDNSAEYRAILGDGIIGNMENILLVCQEHPAIMDELEIYVVNITEAILKTHCTDLYESCMCAVDAVIEKKISPNMWRVYEWLYEAHKNGLGEYFVDIMDCLHHFVVTDPDAFLAQPNRMEIISDICCSLLVDDRSSCDDQARAAKLLEILLLNYCGRINNYVPKFVEIALGRLTKPIESGELKTMCLQVVSAALFANTQLVFPLLCTHPWPNTNEPILENFMKIWFENSNHIAGLHDRRLFVLVTCMLISIPQAERPAAVTNFHSQYLPKLLNMMGKLPECYATKAKLDNDEDSSDEEDEDGNEVSGENAEVDNDEDFVEDDSYLQLLEAVEQEQDDDQFNDEDDDIDDELEDHELTELELYNSQLDSEENEKEEYVVFYRTMTELEQSQPDWYNSLITILSDAQKAKLKEVAEVAVKCVKHKESKKIEQAGGYGFSQTTVPTSFNFGK